MGRRPISTTELELFHAEDGTLNRILDGTISSSQIVQSEVIDNYSFED